MDRDRQIDPAAWGDGTVGVAIPAFDVGPFIGRAIESILRQTRPPDVIVVVDDASTDDTAEIARTFPGVSVLANPTNLGARATSARALDSCPTEFVAFLDGDDAMSPDRIEKQLAVFRDRPEARLVFGLLQPVDPDDRPLGPPTGSPGTHEVDDWLARGMVAGHSTLMLRRPFVNHDDRLRSASDWKLIIDNLTDGSISIVLDEVVGQWRQHPMQSTKVRLAENLIEHVLMCDLLLQSHDWTNRRQRLLRRMRSTRRLQLAAALPRLDHQQASAARAAIGSAGRLYADLVAGELPRDPIGTTRLLAEHLIHRIATARSTRRTGREQ